MKENLIIPLNNANSYQIESLKLLQASFVEMCNAISKIVQASGCWNRVALHHMVYHNMRVLFPEMGSQMICNAIYSVSRTSRIILHHPRSPWNIENNSYSQMPKIIFLPQSPVFFDRHTLSLRRDRLSIYTTNGRIYFDLTLSEKDKNIFHDAKLKEACLVGQEENFSLHFYFGGEIQNYGKVSSALELPNNIQVISTQLLQSI